MRSSKEACKRRVGEGRKGQQPPSQLLQPQAGASPRGGHGIWSTEYRLATRLRALRQAPPHPGLPRGSRPASPLQCHHLGDQDAAATACLLSHKPAGLLATSPRHRPSGPGLAKVGWGSAWPSSSRLELGVLLPPPLHSGFSGPLRVQSPLCAAPTWCPEWGALGQGWQTGRLVARPVQGGCASDSPDRTWVRTGHCLLALCTAPGWGETGQRLKRLC